MLLNILSANQHSFLQLFKKIVRCSRRGRKKEREREKRRLKKKDDLVCSPDSRGHANHNCTYANLFNHGIHHRAQIETRESLARSLARSRSVARRMLVINTFRPLSHARSPFFRASNFRLFRRGHTLVGETLTSDLCLRRARRERKKSERESAAKMTDLVGEPRFLRAA